MALLRLLMMCLVELSCKHSIGLDFKNCTINPFLGAFISWINLDLGIEVCFY